MLKLRQLINKRDRASARDLPKLIVMTYFGFPAGSAGFFAAGAGVAEV